MSDPHASRNAPRLEDGICNEHRGVVVVQCDANEHETGKYNFPNDPEGRGPGFVFYGLHQAAVRRLTLPDPMGELGSWGMSCNNVSRKSGSAP